jgi:Icc-related predicted phosphoesterase
MKEISINKWLYPPTVNRKGKSRDKWDTKDIIVVETDLVDHPTIFTSDLHTYPAIVFRQLNDYLHLDKFVVIAVGDMAGDAVFGSNGDPTESYKYMGEKAMEFYFVQGNHDLPSPNDEHLPWMVQDSIPVETSIGIVAGVNGTISNKLNHPYKMMEEKYMKLIDKCLNPKRKKMTKILLTHDTPSIPVYYEEARGSGPRREDYRNDEGSDKARYIGKEELFNKVDKSNVKMHVFGHCHHPTYHNLINGVHYLNVDARVLILKPIGYEEEIFKQEITNLYVRDSKKYMQFL